MNRKSGKTAGKILLIDVESSPNVGYTWMKWETNVIEFISEKQIICFSWKWLGEKETHVLALPDFPGYKKDKDSNKALILRLHDLFNQADVIVGHNIDDFDDKMSNTDFLKNGLLPPAPHKTIDTLKTARSRFRFNSNRLGDLGLLLGCGEKVDTGGFKLWLGCLEGDMKAWAKMKKYNKGDVILLEKIYYRLRPWMTNHPNMNALDRHVGCPACRSMRRNSKGWLASGQGRRPRFVCLDCGKWYSGVVVKGEWKFR